VSFLKAGYALNLISQEIRAYIRRKVSAAKQGGGYIFHSDHSVPPSVSFENYCYVIELVEKYGKY
jgi:uroporphyrinogen decarboxylase